MKKRLNIYVIVLISLMIYLLITTVRANPVPAYPIENPVVTTTFQFILFFLGIAVEYGIFKMSKITTFVNNRILFRSIFKINLITYPLTQIIAYIIYIYFFALFWIYILIIEIFVIYAEWFLIRLDLTRKSEGALSSGLILRRAYIANISSFLLGLIIYIFPATLY